MSAGPGRSWAVSSGMRGVAALAALTLLAGAGLTGCGIPAGTDVRVDGPLPETGSPQASDDPIPPPGPDQADSEAELVDLFLQAAAANPEEPLEAMREFIHQDDRQGWQPDPQILVVRAERSRSTPTGDRAARVQLSVREIGVLTEQDTIEPRGVAQSRELEFEVVSVPNVNTEEDVSSQVGQRFQLVDPPDEIMLATSALERKYLLPRPVYFWGTEGEVLVPDLRWLPSALPVRQRAQRMLEWLEDGPAPWLPGAMIGLPDDVALAGNAVWSADRLEVPLTGEVDGGRLDAQLWWTLRPELSGDRALVLVIDGQLRELDGDYQAENPTARPDPARFAVVDGVVRQQRLGGELDVPALAGGVGEDIDSAALTWDGRSAALVRAEPDGRLRLSVARAAGPTETDDLVRDRMSRPVWLADSMVGLVAADGQLYRFGTDGRVSPIRVPGGLTEIAAVAAAPDARRVALVADGELYMASIVWQEGSFSMNEPRLLPTTARDLAGVGFIQENWLAFVGDVDGSSLLYEITVDGALERPLLEGDLGAPVSVDNFTAYPGNPTVPPFRGKIMYEAENLAYIYAHALEPAEIQADDMYGVPADAEPGEPRAPFFVG